VPDGIFEYVRTAEKFDAHGERGKLAINWQEIEGNC
jgi:hypothetical protein